jgi:tetratricopeptide (TPR) repeat protein
MDPKYAPAYSNRGNVKLAKGDLDGSIADYTRAIEMNPKYATAYYNRGNVKKDKGDLDGSIADYTRSIEIDSTYAPAYFKRGNVKQGKGDLDGSLADYTRAIEMDPKYAGAYFNRGNLNYNRGSWKDALADYRKSCEFDPSNQDYSRFCVWLTRSRINERDEATKELARYFAERKTGPPDDWQSKIARLLTGDLSEADFLKAADSKDSKVDREQKCEAYFYAGSRRLIDGDKIGAKDLFQKCLETRVMDFSEYTSAAAELKRLGK